VTTDKLKVMGVMLLAVLAVSVGEALLSKGMKQSNAVTGGFWALARGILGNGHVVVGTLLMTTYFGLYMLALRWADLSFVLPLTALSYLFGALLAKLYLGETVTPVRWAGALIITVGVIIVGLGDSGASHTP
jgi:drug/metabolite transporter (DMT)-like permease